MLSTKLIETVNITKKSGAVSQICKKAPIFQIVEDCCEFGKKAYTHDDLYKILTGDFRKINKKFLDSLSDEDYRYCLAYAKMDELHLGKAVLPEDVKDIARFSDILQQGINKIANGKKVKFISIGQSPAIFAQYLALKGMDTAILPISNLRNVTSQTLMDIHRGKCDNYFKYLKNNFNFDINKLDKDTTYIFTDFHYSGGSLKKFKSILNVKGFNGDNVKVMSLQDIVRQVKLSPKDALFALKFNYFKLFTPYLKALYSPIFKVNAGDLRNIEQIHTLYPKTPANKRNNKLIILLYDYLKNPEKHQSKIIPQKLKDVEKMIDDRRYQAGLINSWAMGTK